MNRGEVWWVNFDPAPGSEVKKTRPAVIVSTDAANQYLSRLQVVPLTSNTTRLYPSEAYVTVNGKKGKAMADQIMTVSKKRLTKKMGQLTRSDVKAVERAMKVQLDL